MTPTPVAEQAFEEYCKTWNYPKTNMNLRQMWLAAWAQGEARGRRQGLEQAIAMLSDQAKQQLLDAIRYEIQVGETTGA